MCKLALVSTNPQAQLKWNLKQHKGFCPLLCLCTCCCVCTLGCPLSGLQWSSSCSCFHFQNRWVSRAERKLFSSQVPPAYPILKPRHWCCLHCFPIKAVIGGVIATASSSTTAMTMEEIVMVVLEEKVAGNSYCSTLFPNCSPAKQGKASEEGVMGGSWKGHAGVGAPSASCSKKLLHLALWVGPLPAVLDES